jgi:hypothetical protein
MGFSIDLTKIGFRCWDYIKGKRESNRVLCRDALESIKRERHNFQHIVEGRPYSNDPLHKKAVTVYSFEKVCDATAKLNRVRKFRRDATNLQRLAEHRDAAGVLAGIETLEPKLRKWLG